MEQVRVILANIERMKCEPEEVLGEILPYYAEKYTRYKREEDARQELVCGILLRKYLGVWKTGQVGYGKDGKPFLLERQWKYNLTHSGVWVALGISDAEIGVDIERIRRYHSATARKLFTEEEQVMLEQVESEEARNALFTRLWTEWEAVLKLEGSGFAGGWRENGVDKARYAIWTKEMDGYFLSVATRDAAEICLVEDERCWKG
mgnify:CR=1 FL=1